MYQSWYFRCHSPPYIPVHNETTSDRLTAHPTTVGIPCNLHQYPVGFVLSGVSNGSKLAVRSQVRVGTKLETLQQVIPHQKTKQHPIPRFFGWFHIFTNSELWLQLSIWVLIVSQYDIYVKDAALDARSLAILQFAIRSAYVESLRKWPNFGHYFTANQHIVIGSKIGQWEVKEHLKLRVLRIYHIVIKSELKYLIGGKVLSSCGWGSAVW